MIRQTLHDILLRRVKEPRRFLQVLAGPRQVGKTTLARQVMEAAALPAHYASADEPTLRNRSWLGGLKSFPSPTGRSTRCARHSAGTSNSTFSLARIPARRL